MEAAKISDGKDLQSDNQIEYNSFLDEMKVTNIRWIYFLIGNSRRSRLYRFFKCDWNSIQQSSFHLTNQTSPQPDRTHL